MFGTTTFNDDGTGSDDITGITNNVIIGPPANATTSSSRVTSNFTCTVEPDHTVMVEKDGPISGTVLSGTSAGQTFTIDEVAATRTLSQDRNTITEGITTPTIETVTLSGGVVEHRLCTRSRVLVKINDDFEQ